MVWCPPGEFEMGSPATEAERDDHEGPVHVTLTKGFWIGKYELTQSQWSKVMASTPWLRHSDRPELKKYIVDGPDFPVHFVTWNDAVDFCAKLTQTERAAGRLPPEWEYALPTEAQWEYACRAGTNTAFSFGNDPASLSDYAWWGLYIGGSAKGQKGVLEVGLKKPNPWGLYDMHGNAREWCRDAFVSELKGGTNPYVAPNEDSEYAYRGGSISAPPSQCRSAYRFRSSKYVSAGDHGFRVICVSVE